MSVPERGATAADPRGETGRRTLCAADESELGGNRGELAVEADEAGLEPSCGSERADVVSCSGVMGVVGVEVGDEHARINDDQPRVYVSETGIAAVARTRA